jgi:DNA helicase-2/ATP-dependent DNA helicase PcrA
LSEGATAAAYLPNEAQRQAIETLEGPVLVVAGPGTGKTQLLSQRVANILASRDVSPHNILCLTFTDAGAAAMTHRLAGVIGRDALGVQVSTFHAFASLIKSRYPQYFTQSPLDAPISDLQTKTLLVELLSGLSITDPLFQQARDGVPGNLGDVLSLLGAIRKSGLEAAELEAVVAQNLAFFDYAQKETAIIGLIDDALSGGNAKFAKLDALPDAIAEILDATPAPLTRRLVATPGAYVPYALHLRDAFAQAKGGLYDEDGKTAPFAALRDRFFTARPRAFKDKRVNERLRSALRVYSPYRQHLEKHGLFDYDDMILDCVEALEASEQLRAELAQRYQYVLVDEFQDTNGSQMRLLDLICAASKSDGCGGDASGGGDCGGGYGSDGGGGARPGPNLLVVGDDDQAIYRFQGASVEYMKEFERHYPGTKRIVLTVNYRSTPSLVALGQTAAAQIENRSAASAADKRLVAHQSEAARASFVARAYPNADLQCHAIARSLRERIDAGYISASAHPGEEIAVIARKHESLRRLIPYLKHFGVAYNYQVSASVAQIESLQTMLALIRFVSCWATGAFERATACLPQILAAPELGLGGDECFAVALGIRTEKRDWMAALLGHPQKGFRELGEWLVEMSRLALGSPLLAALHRLAKPLADYYQRREQEDPFAVIEFNYGMSALLRFFEDEWRAAAASAQSGCLRLAKAAELFDESQRFGIDIKVELPLGRPNAVTLTTAHGSKGLEFDHVSIIDADDRSWHKPERSSSYLSSNMLFGNEGDINDERRLLFVALTRARYSLDLSFAATEPVRELIGEVEVERVEPQAAEILAQSKEGWKRAYLPESDMRAALLEPLLANIRMSASLLNGLVSWHENKGDGPAAYFLRRIMRLPAEPNPQTAFGSLIHKLFETLLGRSALAGAEEAASAMAEQFHTMISRLDFDEPQRAHMHERLDRIIGQFAPLMPQALHWRQGDELLAERKFDALVDGVPLTGVCDLLIADPAQRTIRLYDFKTGNPDNAKADAAYLRQLQFYKLLLENCSEYQGWTVIGGADVFVEPSKTSGGIVAPAFEEVPAEKLGHLRLLIQAAWRRLQERRFDVSAFEGSEHYRQFAASYVYSASHEKAGEPKPLTDAALQPAFEQWLIDEFQTGRGSN